MNPDAPADTVDTAADAGGAVELAPRLIPPAAWEGMFLLGKIATDPKAVRRHLRQLHDALAAVSAGQAKLASEREQFTRYVAETTAELEQQRAAVQKRRLDVEAAEEGLNERHHQISNLEAAWRNLGEPDDVKSGFQSPEHSAIEKARRAFEGRPISSERFGQTTLRRSEPGPEAA